MPLPRFRRQLTEFSPNDFTFAVGSSNGVQANYQAERTRFWLSLNDGAYGAKKDFPDNESTDVSLTGRWEYQISGREWSVWDDLVRPSRSTTRHPVGAFRRVSDRGGRLGVRE